MLESLRLYGRYTGVSVRGQMQYRASFTMLAFGHLLATGIEFVGIWFLFGRFGNLRGWRLPDVGLFYGLANVSFAIAEAVARGFDTFGGMVRLGEFDRLLLRPRGTAFQVAAQELQLMRIGRLLQGLTVLIWSANRIRIVWTPARLALIVLIVIGGFCLFFGLFVLQATLAFWTVESLEIMNTVTYGGTETAQYPMTIYRPWFRWFFTFVVPLACINYLPAGPLLHGVHPGLGSAPWHWFTPLAGVAFLAVALRLWDVGVRHYRSTGS